MRFEKINNKNKNNLKKFIKTYLQEITKKKINYEKIDDFFYTIKKKAHFFWIYHKQFKIGFVVLYFNYGNKINTCYIRDMFIRKKFRLKSFGSTVVEKIISRSIKNEINFLKIDILQTNLKVEEFWKQIGFRKKKKSYFYKIKNVSN
jgi:hypothetical protein